MSTELPNEPPKPLPCVQENFPVVKYVNITRITGDGLSAKDKGGTSDPFIRCGLSEIIDGSKFDKKSPDLFFQSPANKESLTFDMDVSGNKQLNPFNLPSGQKVLKIEIWDENKVLKSEWMGCCYVKNDELFLSSPKDKKTWQENENDYTQTKSSYQSVQSGGVKGEVSGYIMIYFEIDPDAIKFVKEQVALEKAHDEWVALVDKQKKEKEAKEREDEIQKMKDQITSILATITKGFGSYKTENDFFEALEKVFDENWFASMKCELARGIRGKWPGLDWNFDNFYEELTLSLWVWIEKSKKAFGEPDANCAYLILIFKIFDILYLDHTLPFKEKGLPLSKADGLDFLSKWVDKVEKEKATHSPAVIRTFFALSSVVTTKTTKIWALAHQLLPHEVELLDAFNLRYADGWGKSYNTKIVQDMTYGEDMHVEHWKGVLIRMKEHPPEKDIVMLGKIIINHLGDFGEFHAKLLDRWLEFCNAHTTSGEHGGIRTDVYHPIFNFYYELVEGRKKHPNSQQYIDPIMKDLSKGFKLYAKIGNTHNGAGLKHNSNEGKAINEAYRQQGFGMIKWPKQDGPWWNGGTFGYSKGEWLV
jgi:hypothetical protein